MLSIVRNKKDDKMTKKITESNEFTNVLYYSQNISNIFIICKFIISAQFGT